MLYSLVLHWEYLTPLYTPGLPLVVNMGLALSIKVYEMRRGDISPVA